MVMLSAALPITRQLRAAPSAPRHAQPGGSPSPFGARFPRRAPAPARPTLARPVPRAAPPCAPRRPVPRSPGRGSGTRSPTPRLRFTLPDGLPEPPCFSVTASARGTSAAAAGRGRPAGSRLCSPAGGAYGAPGRRPQPHRAAPRHAAPHLARLRTRIKGTGGGRSWRGTRPPPPPRWPPGRSPGLGPPPHQENTRFLAEPSLLTRTSWRAQLGAAVAEEQGPEVEERSVGASANIMKQAGRKQSIAAIPGPRERCFYHYDAARRNLWTHFWPPGASSPPPPGLPSTSLLPSDSFGFAGKCSRCGPSLAAAFAPTRRRSRDGRIAEPALWTPPPPPPTGKWGTQQRA